MQDHLLYQISKTEFHIQAMPIDPGPSTVETEDKDVEAPAATPQATYSRSEDMVTESLANKGGCMVGLGKFFGLAERVKFDPVEEVKFRPRHRLRPVSSCSGRIMTVLLADQDPVANVAQFNMREIFDEYRPLIELFKDELITVPNVWMLLNYRYQLHADKHGLRLDKPDSEKIKVPIAKNGKLERDVLYNVRVVRHNFDIPAYLREFTRSLETEISADQITPFGNMGSEWLQDPFYVLQSPDHEIGILDPHYVPPGFLKMHRRFLRPVLTRRFLAREIAASESAVLKPTPYVIEGGNILADQNFLIMGADSFIENWEKFYDQPYHSSFEEMHEQLCRDFGVDLILIPGLKTPPAGENPLTEGREPKLQGKVTRDMILPQHDTLYHLDLFLAPGGYNPETGKEIIFVAECYEKRDGKLVKMPSGRNHCVKVQMGLNAYLDSVADWFENIPLYAKHQARESIPESRKERKEKRTYVQLNELKFEVHRIPCYFDVQAGEVLVSFLNGHFENYRVRWRKQPVCRVYMPDYADANGEPCVREVMEMAAKAYQSAGFEAIPVKYGLEKRIVAGGSFHCMTKVMQRYPYDSSAIRDSDSYTYIPSRKEDTTLKKIGNVFSVAWAEIKKGFRIRKED